MTPVSLVKTTESHVKATESYEACRLGHHIWVLYLPERAETGIITASGQTVRAVHRCNRWSYIYCCCTGSENLARGRRTIQSSTLFGHESERAVDGSYDDTSSCAVTEDEDRPWWMVELDQEVQVHRVVIKTRSNCCGKMI